MKTYKEFINLIKEGLIKTYNILKHSNTLEMNLKSIGYDINLNIIDKYQYSILIFNPKWFLKNDEIFNLFFEFNENMGYFATSFKEYRNERYNIFKIKEKDIKENLNTISKIEIFFESKYELNNYTNILDIPDIAYHLSPVKNKKRIDNYGLVAKSHNRKSFHPDRIYFFYNLDNYHSLLNELKMNDIFNEKQQKYNLYEVNFNGNEIIHSDPNYSKGFYTYDNIHPNNIKIIMKNL